MYPSLLGNLSLWSVISNRSRFAKTGHVEVGSQIERFDTV